MAEIAPDPPGWLTALRFDIDTEGGGAAWIDAELPAPNLIVVNPINGHAHLIYLLGAWVQTDFGDSRRLKVIRYASAIERAYTAALGADTAYAGRFHHNPLSCAYVTKIGRDAPYSLNELARYVDLMAPPQKKSLPTGIGRNVEIFDRLRRWAYTAIADWRIGTHDAWHEAVARRAEQIAVDVGAAYPRGPLKQNELGHIGKSVARWVWKRYVAGMPPLLREAQIASKRERERERQKTREVARKRSRVTRDEYTALARERRSEATEMRRAGLSLRSIAAALRCSLAEIHRLLKTFVQGSPALSDFEGVASCELVSLDAWCDEQSVPNIIMNGNSSESKLFVVDGGAITTAIASEAVASVHSVKPEIEVPDDGKEIRQTNNVLESPIAYIQRRIREITSTLHSIEDRR